LGHCKRLSKNDQLNTSRSITMIQLAFIGIILNKSFT